MGAISFFALVAAEKPGEEGTKKKWILYSGATRHMKNNMDVVNNIKETEG